MGDEILIHKNKRKRFSLLKSIKDLSDICPHLPTDDECFKFISKGGFSSASFVALVSEHAIINNLYCSTFHVGKKEMLLLNSLYDRGKLKNVNLVMFSKVFEKESSKYKYGDIVKKICEKNGWKLKILRNHSKLFLFDTDNGKYVLETSSNLNENPKIEQFSFEKSAECFEFYKKEIFD